MKRLNQTTHYINCKEIDYEIPMMTKTKKIVDDSNFVPESEILKKLNGTRQLSQVELNTFYDFADGKDTGIKVPFERSSVNIDLAILAKDIQLKQENIKDTITQAQEKEMRKQARNAEIQNVIKETTTKTE